MYNFNNSDCSQYLESAEWLRLSDILNEWCKLDQSCKKIKELAILGACENQQIEYTRNDGKSGGVSKSMLTLNEAIIDVKKG